MVDDCWEGGRGRSKGCRISDGVGWNVLAILVRFSHEAEHEDELKWNAWVTTKSKRTMSMCWRPSTNGFGMGIFKEDIIMPEQQEARDETRSLHGLARENNVHERVRLLRSRENLNAKDKYKRWAVMERLSYRTPLHIACFAGSLDAARLLIESGANVNAIALDDLRPLGFAVMKNHLDIVRRSACV